jgi:hypothetical protein
LEDESYMSYYNAGKCDGENKAPWKRANIKWCVPTREYFSHPIHTPENSAVSGYVALKPGDPLGEFGHSYWFWTTISPTFYEWKG